MYLYGGHTTQEGSNVIGEVKMDMFEFDYGKCNLFMRCVSEQPDLIDRDIKLARSRTSTRKKNRT